jgi:hypothetical protein
MSTATDYDKQQDAEIKKLKDKVFGTEPGPGPGPGPTPDDCGPDPDPNNEHVKPGGWGGDTVAANWESAPMKDDPAQFKVVDKSGTNVAHKFASQADADAYIKYHQCIQEKEGGGGGTEEPGPTPTPEGQDKFGVNKIYPDKAGGKYFDDVQYKYSTHNTGTRDTFFMDVGDLLNMETTGYFTINASDKDEECSIKVWGGNHSDKNAKQGRCYGLGVGFAGRPQIYKEYPQHPSGGKHLAKAKLGDLGASISPVLGRNFGMKVIAYLKDNVPTFECWIDNAGLKADGKPSNDWKKFYWCEDRGDWEGEAYTTNQGVANGGKGLYYVRIDTVTEKTKADCISVREIEVPNT